MKKIKAICFDLFNTLIDVASAAEHIGKHTADIFNIDRVIWTDAVFSELHEIRKPTEHFTVIKTLAHSIDSDISDDLIRYAVDLRQARFDFAFENVKADVIETLGKLKKNDYSLALISNASTAEVTAWSDSPLAKFFDSVIFSCKVGTAKPEKKIYLSALNSLDLKPSECLFVGDGGSNELQGAKAVGLTTIMINQYVSHLPEDRLKIRRQYSDYEISRLPELLKIICL